MGDKTPADIVSLKVKDQENITLDNYKLKAIYTPGHTYESFSFIMGIRFLRRHPSNWRNW